MLMDHAAEFDTALKELVEELPPDQLRKLLKTVQAAEARILQRLSES